MGDSGETSIRLAVSVDLDDVKRCVVAAYEPYVERMGQPPAPMLGDYESSIRQGTVHVALRSGRLCGLIVMWAKADHFYIDNVAVSPEAKGHGIGAALLVHAEQEATAAGHDEIRLYTHETMTENIDYYPRRGYVETHRTSEAGYDRIYFSRRLPDGEAY